eukprot:CAMPEP_0174249988 /NCGR_PEP_ID=MMETSP0439-20130205/306_1 /TAXON_ID=0 /ORGANISM="Stereomyxa ramosa, Strain Chinc5" /LENGTH=296 /DNA_ID=CAMNT_0015329943 /DNA_START=37 /DNA_END=930 /DNA_ORIENTATION=+
MTQLNKGKKKRVVNEKDKALTSSNTENVANKNSQKKTQQNDLKKVKYTFGSIFAGQKLLVLFVIVVAIVARISGFTDFFSFESLKKHRAELLVLVGQNPYTAPLVFVGVYAALVALALPGATVSTLAAGFLFAQPFATVYSVLGAATGACCNYYLSTCVFVGGVTRVKESSTFNTIEKGLKESQAIYMMLLRLVPIFPFWFVNIAPAVLGVNFSTFAWTTYVGIIPGTYVYTQCGNGLAAAMESSLESETLTSFLVKGLFNRDIIIGFFLLGLWLCFLLSLRWWVAKKNKMSSQVS